MIANMFRDMFLILGVHTAFKEKMMSKYKSFKYDQACVDKVHALRKQGKTYLQIAEEMGWQGKQTVRYLLSKRKKTGLLRKVFRLFF